MSLDEQAPIAEHRALRDAWDDLDEHLIGDETDLPERLEDHVTAERMMASVRRRREELARWGEVARRKHEQIDLWLDAHRHRLDTSYFENCLTDYHAALLAQDKRAKTVSLPSGSLVSRQGQPRWDIDPDTFVPWAETNAPDLLRVKVEPDKASIKQTLLDRDGTAVTSDGEVVPGVAVEPGEVGFTIRVGES